MKRMIPLMLALTISPSAFADEHTGQLECLVSAMNKNRVGTLEPVRISEPEKHVKESFFGPMVVADLEEASNARLSAITKTVTSDAFRGEVKLNLGFIYQEEKAPGNLIGASISLEYLTQGFLGGQKSRARAEADFPLGASMNHMQLDLHSTSGDLVLLRVSCVISKEEALQNQP